MVDEERKAIWTKGPSDDLGEHEVDGAPEKERGQCQRDSSPIGSDQAIEEPKGLNCLGG